jgi:anti-anti-sigma regulatory factor
MRRVAIPGTGVTYIDSAGIGMIAGTPRPCASVAAT